MPKWTIKYCCAFPRNSTIDLELDTPLFRWSAATHPIRVHKQRITRNNSLVHFGFLVLWHMLPLMITRLAVPLFVLIAPVLPLVAQEHPRAPQQSQSQQLPQTRTGAPQATMVQSSMSDVSDGLKRFISGYAAKSADKKFHVPYQRKNLALDLLRLHDDRFSSLGGDKYFACVDMKGADGKIYDIDFFMLVQTGKLTVTETSVHKINGKPLYNWKQEGGVWKKVKVS